MKFTDKYVFKSERFSVGCEESSGRFYVSIPVANPYVEYEEYYEIDRAQYDNCPGNFDELKVIVQKCRNHENDSNLLVLPGRLRGAPV